MKLHVVCRSADEVRDLEIEAGAESRVADLTEGAGLVVDGRRVGPQVLLADAGLYEGAVIDITDQPPAVSPGDVTEHERVLAIVGGVAAGRTFPLTGDTVIGRDVSCDIVLDDPAVSPRHARVTDDGDVVDLGSTNGTWVGDGLIRIGATQLRVRSIDDRDRPSTARDGMTIPFNRPPRPAPPTPPVEPALAPATRSFGAAMVLGPLLMAGAMVAIYGDPRFAVFAVLAPVTAAITWITAKGAAWRDRRAYARERRAYEQALDRHLCDPAEIVRRATQPSVRLWERRADHDDFLHLRVGAGAATVAVDLSHGGVIGVVGTRAAALALARSLVVQAAVHHGPADLGIRVHGEADWEWTKWLPHTLDQACDRVTLVVVDQADGAARLLNGDAGIVLAPTLDQLPSACTTTVVVRSDLGDTDTFLIAGIDTDVATTCARALARYEDPELDGAGLPDRVALSSVLDTTPMTRPVVSIGVDHDGTAEIDLERDGPHVLIGGTTGSGKSELLRTLVVGLAARLAPTQVTFVLVDYKGGSAFDACARLPHVVGLVTDLDEHLAERALRSLRAELRFRERTQRDGCGAEPRLVVVVDEFATLAAELPDFLGALVDVAQRGRSLGVHLVLATQRPSGVVSPHIKANTNLRIALRVQDTGDSTDIIDDPAAARISRSTPGRAYIRRGAGDLLAVQTAYASAPHHDDGARVRVRPFLRRPIAVETVDDDSGRTELSVVVDAIGEAWTGARPRRPWLPMLPERVERRDLPAGSFALVDEPDHQRQWPLEWNPDDGHLALYGMPGSGTTTALLAAVDALVHTHTPTDCHIYAIDYGSNGLASLRDLPHVGAVIGAGERERQTRLLRRLHDELHRRRSSDADGPRVVVCVDGIGAFLADRDDMASLDELDAFRRVFTEGSAVGIHFIVTADSASALPNRLASLVGQKLRFRLADPSDHRILGGRAAQLPRFLPGRAVFGSNVVQVALPGAGDVAGERVAPPIRTLPREVSADVLPPPLIGEPLAIAVGIADDDLDVAYLRLHRGENVLVCGPPRSGKTSALEVVEKQLRAAGAEVMVIDDAPHLDDPHGEIAARLRDDHLHVIAAGRTDEVRAAYGHWLRTVRQSRTGLLLQPDLTCDGDLLGVRLPRRVHVDLTPGRGFLVENGVSRLVQVAR